MVKFRVSGNNLLLGKKVVARYIDLNMARYTAAAANCCEGIPIEVLEENKLIKINEDMKTANRTSKLLIKEIKTWKIKETLARIRLQMIVKALEHRGWKNNMDNIRTLLLQLGRTF